MIKYLIVLSVALATSGCGLLYKQPIYQGNLIEKSAVDQLQAGMAKQQVLTLLGSPSISDPFHHQRWDYTSTQRINRGTQKTKGRYLKDSHTKFHNYAVEGSDQNIDFTVDGKTNLSFQNRGNGNEEWPFDRKFHLIMNIAVGGNWGGQKGIDDNIFPQKMEVDYVRVFQKSKQTKP